MVEKQLNRLPQAFDSEQRCKKNMGETNGHKPTLVIVSGYFSPLHVGHLELIEAGAALGDKLAVIVNNNNQQVMKKGKIIMEQEDRVRIVRALRVVDDAIVAIDTDRTVNASIEFLVQKYPDHKVIFGNGGDRDDNKVVPESVVCEKYGVEMRFDVGGNNKADSSSRLIEELGLGV